MRICRKVPDLQEHFVEKAKMLLSDRNHGVMLCGLTLVVSMCEAEEQEEEGEEVIDMFKPLVGSLVKILKSLAGSGYAPEHDVAGIADPFLQVKILRLLRVLGRGDGEISEQINDILAQVATNTDSSKNVGNSILYETVLTILEIEADSGLRVLGVNILGKFLTNKDNNIRYVALNTLIKVVAIEPNAVQRHRNTILDCLRDPDISIRRRALDLSFTLINEGNVRVLIRELLAFLEVADIEFKPVMTSQIGVAADRYAPNKRWHIDTMLRVLKLAGNHVKEQILSSFLRLIATSPDHQTYTVHKLYAYLKDDISQEGLNIAGAWTIGEYGDLLLQGAPMEEEDLGQPVHESDIVDLFGKILASGYAGLSVTQYIITSGTKLTTRFNEPSQIERLRRMLLNHQANLDIEIQQRAMEYGNLFNFDQVRQGVLEKMPPPEIKEEQRVLGEKNAASSKKRAHKAPKPKINKVTDQDSLLDLMGDDSGLNGSAASPVNGTQNNADLLADILGGTDVQSSTSHEQPRQQPRSNNADIMGLFGDQGSSQAQNNQKAQSAASNFDLLNDSAPTPSAAPAPDQGAKAYSSNFLQIFISVRRDGAAANAMARLRNASTSAAISNVSLQVAVPKKQKLQLQAFGGETLQPGAEASQGMRITEATGVST